MRRSVIIASVVCALGLGAAGCSPSNQAEQKTENANAAVCLSLKGLEATIAGLKTGVTGTGDVTVGKAQESINQIATAYDTVDAEIQKLGQDVSQEVLTAEEQFQQAQMQIKEGLSGLDGDQSLADLPQEQQQAVEQLQSSYQQLNASLGCT
ncbi:MAG TPA: hypothetical protein PLT68_06175 [Actinomycetota bacterium]|nr:hypothetical protein [Actinomycetota bacterium]